MTTITVHGKLQNPRTVPIQVAAAIAKLNVVEQFIDSYAETKSEQILKVNPMGQIPVIQVGNTSISQLNSILRFIARENPSSGLYGQTPFENSQVDQWLDFNNTNIAILFLNVSGHYFLPVPQNEENTQLAVAELQNGLQILNDTLAATEKKTFLVGSTITIADIALVSFIQIFFRSTVNSEIRKKFPHVVTWVVHTISLPQFRAVQGDVTEKNFIH